MDPVEASDLRVAAAVRAIAGKANSVLTKRRRSSRTALLEGRRRLTTSRYFPEEPGPEDLSKVVAQEAERCCMDATARDTVACIPNQRETARMFLAGVQQVRTFQLTRIFSRALPESAEDPLGFAVRGSNKAEKVVSP